MDPWANLHEAKKQEEKMKKETSLPCLVDSMIASSCRGVRILRRQQVVEDTLVKMMMMSSQWVDVVAA